MRCISNPFYSKNRFYAKVCLIFYTLSLIFISLTFYPQPAYADPGDYKCVLTYVDTDTKQYLTRYGGYIPTYYYNYNSNTPNNFCYETALYNAEQQMTHSDSMVLIKTEVFPADSYPDGPLVTEWNITRFLTPQELDTYNCLFSSASPQLTPGYLTSAGTVLINLLPSSPDSVRIPTIINQALGQGTLGANVAIELYSTIWQFLTVILLIKFYKLIPFKAT